MKFRFPKIFNLRLDPFERADYNSNRYWDWVVDNVPMMYEMQALVAGRIRGALQSSRRADSRHHSIWTR